MKDSMGKQQSDNLSREDFQREQAAPRRHGGVRRAAKLLAVLVLVLAVVLVAAYQDLSSFDSVRRLFSYNKVTQDEQGKAELYSFDNDRTNVYAMLGERLIVASTTNVAVLANDGTRVYSESVRMTHPAVAVGGQTVLVYDIGGQTALLLGEKGLLRDCGKLCDAGILSASLNSSDYLTLTTEKSGYQSVVSVYDPTGNALFTFNSSDRYVMDACVLRDCKHLAVVTLGEADGAFASTLKLYALLSETPESVNVLNGSLVLSLGNLGGRLVTIADDRLTVFGADGSLSGSYRYDYPYLRAQSTGGTDYTALLLSRYRSGSTLKLVTVSADGEKIGESDIGKEVLCISAAGKYLAALYSDSLTIYTSDLSEYATLSNTEYAKSVIMREDGTALLLGTSSAWLFIP